jgi:hypothetical protein
LFSFIDDSLGDSRKINNRKSVIPVEEEQMEIFGFKHTTSVLMNNNNNNIKNPEQQQQQQQQQVKTTQLPEDTSANYVLVEPHINMPDDEDHGSKYVITFDY